MSRPWRKFTIKSIKNEGKEIQIRICRDDVDGKI